MSSVESPPGKDLQQVEEQAAKLKIKIKNLKLVRSSLSELIIFARYSLDVTLVEELSVSSEASDFLSAFFFFFMLICFLGFKQDKGLTLGNIIQPQAKSLQVCVMFNDSFVLVEISKDYRRSYLLKRNRILDLDIDRNRKSNFEYCTSIFIYKYNVDKTV